MAEWSQIVLGFGWGGWWLGGMEETKLVTGGRGMGGLRGCVAGGRIYMACTISTELPFS